MSQLKHFEIEIEKPFIDEHGEQSKSSPFHTPYCNIDEIK